MARSITLRSWVTHDGDSFLVTYISRRPRLGHGLYCVLENPRRGLKIVPYRALTKKAVQAKSVARLKRVTRYKNHKLSRYAV
jgi:hypothetical protein